MVEFPKHASRICSITTSRMLYLMCARCALCVCVTLAPYAVTAVLVLPLYLMPLVHCIIHTCLSVCMHSANGAQTPLHAGMTLTTGACDGTMWLPPLSQCRSVSQLATWVMDIKTKQTGNVMCFCWCLMPQYSTTGGISHSSICRNWFIVNPDGLAWCRLRSLAV